MKRYTTTLTLFFIVINSLAQVSGNYTLYIQHDTAIQWAAESDKVINLSPKINAYSLKKWYLEKIRKGVVTAYKMKDSRDGVSSYQLSMPSLTTQDWLKGLSIEIPSYKNPKEWYFYDKNIPKENYEYYKFRVGGFHFSDDSCCGCDEADAFRAKQVLSYKNGKFSIYNVFVSPLCARQTTNPPFEWYPLCNVAYNDNRERKFPGLSKDVALLNTDEVDYDFSPENTSSYDSVLTVYRSDIGNLIYQDVLKGRIKPVDPETGKLMPVNKFLTWKMPSDTIPQYDINDPSKIDKILVVQQERNPRDFNHIRIKQDLYFDFKNERLYSVVRSVGIVLAIKTYDGRIRGYALFCRISN